jgi:hypothetical protein
VSKHDLVNFLLQAEGPVVYAAQAEKASRGSVLERLTDTKRYTGAHKHRFDENGRGRGLQGRTSDGVSSVRDPLGQVRVWFCANGFTRLPTHSLAPSSLTADGQHCVGRCSCASARAPPASSHPRWLHRRPQRPQLTTERTLPPCPPFAHVHTRALAPRQAPQLQACCSRRRAQKDDRLWRWRPASYSGRGHTGQSCGAGGVLCISPPARGALCPRLRPVLVVRTVGT